MFARCMAWISSSIAAGWFLEVPGTELLLILALCLLPFSATCRSELPGTACVPGTLPSPWSRVRHGWLLHGKNESVSPGFGA